MVLPGRIIPSPFATPFPSLLLLPLLLLPLLTIAKPWNKPSSVGVPASWTARQPYDINVTGYGFKVVLYRQNSGPSFFCGFMCPDGNTCGFGLFIFQPTQGMKNIKPEYVWYTSPESVGDAAQMLLTKEGDLVLLGDSGNNTWSSNTAGKSIVGLNLTEAGNLVLYDSNDTIIWQSFDHPRDRIVPGQVLRPGIELTVPSELPNGMALVYTFATEDRIGFVASVTSASSPQIYYRTSNVSKMKSDTGEALYKNGSFGELDFPPTSSAQFISLRKDGHLMLSVYDDSSNDWKPKDLLEHQVYDSNYPFVCGSYGICSYWPRLQCNCPVKMKEIEERYPSSGCNHSSPNSCDSLNNTFEAVEHVTFFALSNSYISADITNTTAERCKEACLKKGCSCTMALFRNQTSFSGGDCYLLSDSFSLIDDYSGEYSTSAFIKVNSSSDTPTTLPILPRKKRGRTVFVAEIKRRTKAEQRDLRGSIRLIYVHGRGKTKFHYIKRRVLVQ